MTIFEAYNETKKALENAGIEDYVFEAKQIIKHITGFSNAEILMKYTNRLTGCQQNRLTAIIRQRELRYPLQYIFGEWSFYGRDFYVGPGVLTPRADTETLIEKSLEFLKGKAAPRILDLCAGSGCIGITLAALVPDSRVLMVEKFREAAEYARKNISRNGAANVALIEGDVFERAGAEDGGYDLIVSNPPYIPDGELDTVSPETKYEPETALAGGGDGLDFYRAIAGSYGKSLKRGGMMLFEAGIGQAGSIKKIFDVSGFSQIGAAEDLNGILRAVFAVRS